MGGSSDGKEMPTCAMGCLSRSFARVSAEKSAMTSSEHRILTAAEMFPSCSLAETAASLDVVGSRLALLEAVLTSSSSAI